MGGREEWTHSEGVVLFLKIMGVLNKFNFECEEWIAEDFTENLAVQGERESCYCCVKKFLERSGMKTRHFSLLTDSGHYGLERPQQALPSCEAGRPTSKLAPSLAVWRPVWAWSEPLHVFCSGPGHLGAVSGSEQERADGIWSQRRKFLVFMVQEHSCYWYPFHTVRRKTKQS